mgnify:CR=1 FL=1
MNNYPIILMICLLFINLGVAQNYQSGVITTTKDTSLKGRVFIDNDLKKVYLKNSSDQKDYNFKEVKSIIINQELYSKINFNNEEYFINILVFGKASLYQINKNNFLLIHVSKQQKINIIEDQQQIPGLLSLIFKDCNSIRDEINKTEEFSKKTLFELTTLYNTCDYQAYGPTEKELSTANTFDTDSYEFYGSLLGSINNNQINNFATNNTNGFGVGIGLASSPSFMRNLKGNLFIDFDLSVIWSGANEFENEIPLNLKQNSYRLSLGIKYVFNKEGVVLPFLGIGYGYSSDYYNGTIGTIDFKDHKQNFFFTPKVGVLYKFKNKKLLGLSISYLTTYENDLSFRYNEDLSYYPLIINQSSFNAGLNYYF